MTNRPQPGLFDPGLQPERTALAWQRTCLALMVGALTAARFGLPVVGGWALLLGAVGSVVSVCLLVLSRRRYRRATSGLCDPEQQLRTGGWLPLTATVVTFGGGLFLLGLVALGLPGMAQVLPR